MAQVRYGTGSFQEDEIAALDRFAMSFDDRDFLHCPPLT